MYQPNGMPPWWQAQGQGAPGQMPGQVGMGRQAPTQQPMPQMGMDPRLQPPSQWAEQRGMPERMARPAVMPNPYARNDYGSQMGPHPGFAGPGFGGGYQPPPMGFFGMPGEQRFGGMRSPAYTGGMLQNPNWRPPQPGPEPDLRSAGHWGPTFRSPQPVSSEDLRGMGTARASWEQEAPGGGRAQLLAMYQQMMGAR